MGAIVPVSAMRCCERASDRQPNFLILIVSGALCHPKLRSSRTSSAAAQVLLASVFTLMQNVPRCAAPKMLPATSEIRLHIGAVWFLDRRRSRS